MDATRIKKILEDKGLSQVEVAAEIGVTPQAVNEIISGRTVSRTARYAFAKAIGMSVDELWPSPQPAGAR